MRHVTCHECNRRYDFDKDDFCPRCGAFTPPPKKWDVDARGNVVRVDGVNENNHAGSFVHREVHKEKVARRVKGLDRDERPATSRKAAYLGSRQRGGPSGTAKRKKTGFGLIFLLFWMLLNMLFRIID